MTLGSPSSNRIVDLLQYKRARPQRRLDFDASVEARPRLAAVTSFRPLSEQDISHRERMIRHLTLTSSR